MFMVGSFDGFESPSFTTISKSVTDANEVPISVRALIRSASGALKTPVVESGVSVTGISVITPLTIAFTVISLAALFSNDPESVIVKPSFSL